MRNIVFSLFLSVLTVASASADEDDLGTKCALVAQLAAQVMELRQMGAPMHEVMTGFGAGPLQEMVIDAYRRGRFTSEANKRAQLEDFRDLWTLRCYQAG